MRSLLLFIVLCALGCTIVDRQTPAAPAATLTRTLTSPEAFKKPTMVPEPAPPVVQILPKQEDTPVEPATTAPEPPAPPEPPAKPGPTLIFGDSTNLPFTMKGYRDALGVDGEVKALAKGGELTSWLLMQLSLKSDSYFAGFQNAIIVMGANDLGTRDSVEVIWTRLTRIYELLRGHDIKVFAGTIAPAKGNPYGMWALDYADTEANRLEINRRIRESPLVDHVIDLAAPVKEGGLADNDDPQKMADNVLLRSRKVDPVHPKGEVLVAIYQRELAKLKPHPHSRT